MSVEFHRDYLLESSELELGSSITKWKISQSKTSGKMSVRMDLAAARDHLNHNSETPRGPVKTEELTIL